MRLVVDAPVRVVVALGFDLDRRGRRGRARRGRARPDLLRGPRLAPARRCCASAAARAPCRRCREGDAWLFVELAGDDPAEVRDRARGAGRRRHRRSTRSSSRTRSSQARLWRIREDGAGMAGRSPAGRPAWPGWEDAAVPPDRLGSYLARFDELVDLLRHDLGAVRPLRRRLHARAPRLPARPARRHRGAARVPRSTPPRSWGSTAGRCPASTATAARAASCCRTCTPRRDRDVRRRSSTPSTPPTCSTPACWSTPTRSTPTCASPAPSRSSAGRTRLAFAYPHDDGDLAQAVHRCTGVGKCRADNTAAGGVMCPSYLATREEKDSTRGRARVLQDVVRGELAWAAPEVHDALDLCLSCKGCASDCPTGIDMATYKSEVLHQTYRRRLRPRSHYSLGRLPLWARLAGARARPAWPTCCCGCRCSARSRCGRPASTRRRSVPAFARRPFRRDVRGPSARRPAARRSSCSSTSFTDAFDPEVAAATVRVLEAAGYAPRLPDEQLCCGLTWITTGQLDAGPPHPRRARSPRSAVAAARRRADRRHRAVVHRRAAQRRRRAARQRRRPASVAARDPHPRRAARRDPRLDRRPTSPAPRWSPSRTATTTR